MRIRSLEERQKVVEIAKTWIGTPYLSNAMVRGPRGGVDCAMILVGVYREAGWIPQDFDPRPYPPHWHLHKQEEKYLSFVRLFASEIQEKDLLPADVVLFQVSRLFAHAVIVIDWPLCIGARAPGRITLEDVMQDHSGKHALAKVNKLFFRVN